MVKCGCMRNGRLKYEELKAYALNGVCKWSGEERKQIFSWAYGMIEEIQNTYNTSNGNGFDKLNGVFENKLESLRSQGIEQAKKLSLIAILDESPVVRKVAIVLLLGLATKITNSEKNPKPEEIQLAHDIFRFVISYVQDSEISRVKQDCSLLNFILKKSEAYRSVILTLTNLHAQPEEPISVKDWDSMIQKQNSVN
ncbi:MAG: hypothetical protein QXG02_00400 [Candidatus Anstonellales archaeon]